MKAKKIIIGLIAVIALLITIAGALAAVEPTATYNPTSNSVTVNQTQQTNFSITVTNPDMYDVEYQWLVDGLPVSSVVQEGSNFTASYLFDSTGKSLGNHIVSVAVNGAFVSNLSHAWTVTIEDAAPTSLLSVTKVKVNGKTNGKLTLSDVNEVEVEVSNDHTQKIEDITVTVRILDGNDEIVDEEDEISKLSAGDEDTLTFEFYLSDEDLEEEDYTLEVEVEGEDTDGDDFSDLETLTVKVDREKDDLVITKVDLKNSQVLCSAPQTSLDVHIKNVGENDQDGAKITVKNAALGVDMQKPNIDLDDYSGSDNDYEATFDLHLEDAKQGTYMLDVAVYSEDNEEMDSEEVELQVSCPGGTSQEEQSEEQYADKALAAELQKKIDEYKAMQEAQTASQDNFRQSNSYVLLLGVLVAMMFFAAVLSATFLLVKRK